MPQSTILINPIRVTLFVAALVTLFTVLCDGRKQSCRSKKKASANRIINGYEINPGDFPEFVSMSVSMGADGGLLCSGVLIEEDLVLTAAHCVQGYQRILVAPSIYHPSVWKKNRIIPYRGKKACQSKRFYSKSWALYYDFAVVILEEPVENARIAALEARPIRPGQRGIAVGIGYIKYFESGKGEDPIKAFALPMESVECHRRNQHESHVCFSSYDPKFIGDVCYGDSGGPVFSSGPNSTVLGLTSYGNPDGECLIKKAKSVFVDVPNMKKEIEELVRECRTLSV